MTLSLSAGSVLVSARYTPAGPAKWRPLNELDGGGRGKTIERAIIAPLNGRESNGLTTRPAFCRLLFRAKPLRGGA